MTCETTCDSVAGPEQLRQRLCAILPGFGQVEWLGVTGSTNADLGDNIRSGTPSMLATLPWLRGTHLQTAGKGRAGRAWANQSGQCLMFSVAMPSPVPIAALVGLPPVLGVVATQALRDLIPGGVKSRLTLKWPNDILWDQAKLAGILVETVKHPDMPHPIIIAGIGLNLSGASRLTEDMGRPIADWSQVRATDTASLHQHVDAAELVASIARAWSNALARFALRGFAGFTADVESMDALAGQEVVVMDQGSILMQGIACGCDESGKLLIQTAEGICPVMVGDVSIRPVGDVLKDLMQ